MAKIGHREEVLNVELAKILSKRQILIVPESILKVSSGKKLPDLIIGNYWGARLNIEGKFNEGNQSVKILTKQCKERVEQGIASISIGVLYPPDLRYADWLKLESSLEKASLKIKIFSELGDFSPGSLDWHLDEDVTSGWLDTNLDGLASILRRAYQSLVNDDIVEKSAKQLKTSIDIATEKFSNFEGIEKKLETLLIVPYSDDSDDEDG